MKWILSPLAEEGFFRKFLKYSSPILQILWNRGVRTQEEIEDFFCPRYEKMHDPLLMKGVDALVFEVKALLRSKKRIGIFTDFDVDGITGAAIFIETMVNLGFPKKLISLFIPDREKEGYGINENGINFLRAQDCKIFISIDCGISNFKEIELVRKLGMKPIIIDHHQVPKKLPRADIIINPLQKDDKYPFKNLAAAGIVFKISQALIKKIKKPKFSHCAVDKDEWSSLGLACLATIADCCPLLGENRILVKYGLISLQKTKRVGINEIFNLCRIEKSSLDAIDISHRISPLLNSASRMDHATTAYNLITTDSIFEAAFLAKKLVAKNRQRQESSRKVFSSLDNRVAKYGLLPNIIIEADPDWPLTLAGPVASKILEKYSRPAIVFNRGHKKSQSSSRSVLGFNMVEALERCSKYIEKFGGHPMAAGCTVDNKNFNNFKICMNQVARDYLKKEDLVSILEVEAEIEPRNLNIGFFEEIKKFSPFGMKNQKPRFLMKGLLVEEVKNIGKNQKTLRFLFGLKDSKRIIKGIWQNQSNNDKKFHSGDIIDVVFELEIDEWNGYKELVLKIIDLRLQK